MALAKQKTQEKIVNSDLVAKALAKAVYEGNIVNFRLLFGPFSPARSNTPERFETEKYAYLLPDRATEDLPEFRKCLGLVHAFETRTHIEKELEAKRPPQLPSELLIVLADNAVRGQKYSTAAQAYEMLRIRRRMQEEFFVQADKALDANDIPIAVRGYRIGTGLGYNYSAFPEPLPVVMDYQTQALMLHGEYPERPEACIGVQPVEIFMRTALAYLLLDHEAAARLESRPLAVRLAFLKELVRQGDPTWDTFATRYREAVTMTQEHAERLQRALGGNGSAESLAAEIAAQSSADPRGIAAHLLGREIADGEWWQYLKDLAFVHPAAALFVARQIIGTQETLIPRCAVDSPAGHALGLLDAAAS